MPRTGRWKKGESGNPAGRKPELPPMTLEWMETQRQLHCPAVLATVIAQAKGGCRMSQRLLLDRWVPTPKDGVAVGVMVHNHNNVPAINVNFLPAEPIEAECIDVPVTEHSQIPMPEPDAVEPAKPEPNVVLPGPWRRLSGG